MKITTELKLGGNALAFYSIKLHEFCIRRDITPNEVELEEREYGVYAWIRTTAPTYKETMILDADKIHEEIWEKLHAEVFIIFQEMDSMERRTELKLGGNALAFYSEKLHKFCIRRDITPKEVELEEREYGQYAWIRTTPPTYKETMILDSDKIQEEIWKKEDSELFIIFQDIDVYDETMERIFEDIEAGGDTDWEALIFEYQKDKEKLWIAKDNIESGKGVAEEYLEKVEESKSRPAINNKREISKSSPSPF